MTVPRPTIRLVQSDNEIVLVESKDSSKDYTGAMARYSKETASQLSQKKLCGYVVCANSPTCGMERVKVYKENSARKEGVGLYTSNLMEAMPWLPIEEDGRLNDPALKENFVNRVFSLHDFYCSMGEEPTVRKIIEFHSRYKLTLMAHHPEAYKEMGRLVADVKSYPIDKFFTIYRLALMKALQQQASRKNNTNVLMHVRGYFKRSLSKTQKQEIGRLIEDYRKGELPLVAPLVLLKHYLSSYPNDYLSSQAYFDPYPQELRLRYGL